MVHQEESVTNPSAVHSNCAARTGQSSDQRWPVVQRRTLLQDSDRAGFTPPITVVPNIDTVEVTDIDLTVLGHGYYAEAAPVLYDMTEVLTHNSPPDRRTRIRRAGTSGQALYWMIAK
jgi:hypothetical protein